MLFNSFTYIFFLAITVLLYWRIPNKHRICLLLLASYVFYMSWSPPFGVIYAPVIFLDTLYFYVLSLGMVRWPSYKKQILVIGITTELLLLVFFKYSNFIAHSTDKLLAFFHFPMLNLELNIFLPLAISFTNFVLISYLVDVYRGNEEPDKSFSRFATYVAFFPHLIAGPIVRAKELLAQFDKNPSFECDRFFNGVNKFIIGLALKVFIADQLAPYVNSIYGDVSLQNFATGWVATYGFAIEIFCDFLGYTLMAQGSALLFGYTLPENFNAPYLAKNISDFWHRWHISLSRWLKDYLYIPLGGNRYGKLNTYRNLFITMILGGLWHGAGWNFVIWGFLHGLYLSLHKFGERYQVNKLIPGFVALFLTFHAVCLAWVFFRAQSFDIAMNMISVMVNPASDLLLSMEGKAVFLLVVLFLVGHYVIHTYNKLLKPEWVLVPIRGVFLFILIYLGLTLRIQAEEFIYFQF